MSDGEEPVMPEKRETQDARAARTADLRDRLRVREQLRYSRRWQEDERAYNRKQSEVRFKVVSTLGVWIMAILSALACSKVFREHGVWQALSHAQYSPQAATSADKPNQLPPTLLLVETLQSGDMTAKPAERGGTPIVPPEVFVKLIDKLFDGGTAAVSGTADLTRKFAEAGIRITEDAAKQILAAMLRPGRTPPSAASPPIDGDSTPVIRSIQQIVSCGPSRGPTVPPSPPTSHPRPNCSAQSTSIPRRE